MNPAETLELADQIKSLSELGLTILLIEHKLDVVNDDRRHGRSCSTTARRSPRAGPTRCGATRRCCALISDARAARAAA